MGSDALKNALIVSRKELLFLFLSHSHFYCKTDQVPVEVAGTFLPRDGSILMICQVIHIEIRIIYYILCISTATSTWRWKAEH